MAKFIKKPVIVEAVQIASIEPFGVELTIRGEIFPWWLEEALHQRDVRCVADRVLIDTLEGTMEAKPEDWIVRGIKGELYPVKDNIFRETYDNYKENDT